MRDIDKEIDAAIGRVAGVFEIGYRSGLRRGAEIARRSFAASTAATTWQEAATSIARAIEAEIKDTP